MKKFALLFALTFFAFPQSALARSFDSVIPNRGDLKEALPAGKANKEYLREVKEKKADQLKEFKEEKIQQICERVQARVKKRVERFIANRESHLERYQSLRSKLAHIVSKLKEKGFDTSQLEADLETLDGLIKDYAREYQEFIDLLGEALDLSCGDGSGDFRALVGEALAQLREARQARRAIWQFYKDNIREDIKDLRQQAEEMSSGVSDQGAQDSSEDE